jgi:hypothetical protein
VRFFRSATAAFLLAGVGGAGQQLRSEPADLFADPCAEYFGCVEYRPLSEAEARSSRGYPRPVAAQTARLLPEKLAGDATWLEQPSLMDTSWRRWPSLTDF